MDRRTLDHALKGCRWHGFGPFDISDQSGQVIVDEIFQILAQVVQIDRTGAHDARSVRFINQGQQQMFQRGQFVLAFVGQRQRTVDLLLECR